MQVCLCARPDVPELDPLGTVLELEATLHNLSDKSISDKPVKEKSKSKNTQSALTKITPMVVSTTEFEIGDGIYVRGSTSDQEELIGEYVIVPNELWDDQDSGATKCRVSAYVPLHTFPTGRSHQAFVITDPSEDHYMARADFIRDLAQ